MKNTVKKIISSYYFPFFLYTVLMMIFHLLIDVNYGDDIFFRSKLDEFTAQEFLTMRYETWASRIIIEGVLINISRVPWMWKILDTLIMAWLPLAFSLFFNPEKKRIIDWSIIGIFIFFPYDTMRSAGWMATTLNYSWPLAFGLLAIMPLRNSLYKKRTPWYLHVFSITASIYASNQEQMCAILIALNVLLGGYLVFRDKKIPWIAIVQLLIGIASMLFILTCPGNDNRTTLESLTWFPQFMGLSFLQKLELGYMRTMYATIIRINMIFIVFCVLLLAVVIKTNKKLIFRCIAAFPLVAALIMGALAVVCRTFKSAFYQSEDQSFEFGNIIVKIALIAATIAAVCVIVSLISVFKKSVKTLLSLIILGIGFAPSVVLGFSPTLWASSYRIFLFLNMAFMAVSVILIVHLYQSVETKEI